MKIYGIYAAFPIYITLFFNLLKWYSSKFILYVIIDRQLYHKILAEKIFTKTKSKSRLDDCTATFLQEKESSTDTTCNTSINTKYFAEIISAIITYLSTEKIGKLPPERFQFSSNKGAFEAQQLYFLSLSWWSRRGYPLTERLHVSINHLYT